MSTRLEDLEAIAAAAEAACEHHNWRNVRPREPLLGRMVKALDAASFAAVVVLPDPCNPMSRITAGRFCRVKGRTAPPRNSISAS